MSRTLPLLLLLTASPLAVSCSFECGPDTCAFGCCDKGICFEGGAENNGVQCGSGIGVGTGDGGSGGTSGAGGGGGTTTQCGSYNDACKASLGLYCCSGYFCRNERCAFCDTAGEECTPGSTSSPCCPGLTCLLKPGFTSIYECR